MTHHPTQARTRPGRARIAAALMCAALALAGCGDATGPLPSEGPPEDMEFNLGGFGATSRSLHMRADTVVVFRVDWEWAPGAPMDSLKVVPSADAWRSFWVDANRAGVRLWKRRYRQEDIVDGGGYSLRIVTDGGVIESAGSNAYPDRFGREHEGESTDAFRGFVDAIGDLIGEPF